KDASTQVHPQPGAQARLPLRVRPVQLTDLEGHPEARRRQDGRADRRAVRTSAAGGAVRRRDRPRRGEEPRRRPRPGQDPGPDAYETTGLAETNGRPLAGKVRVRMRSRDMAKPIDWMYHRKG